MTEEKKTFERTVPLTEAELKAIINDKFGLKLKLKDVPVGKHLVMKITEAVQSRDYLQDAEDPESTKTSFSIKAIYRLKNGKDVPLTVQIGEGAVKSLNTKFPNNTYVGMMAFFKQTKFKGKFPQFVTPFKGDFQAQSASLDELFGSTPVAEEEPPEMNVQAPTVEWEQLSQRADIKEVIDNCVKQGNKFTQAFSDTVLYEGKSVHAKFHEWLESNNVQISISNSETLYAYILSKVIAR